MDDTAAGIAVGLLAALVLHGSLNRRAARAAERQMSETFTGTGSIRAVVREQAPFGIFANDLRAIDVYCEHVSALRVPFTQIYRLGWKGRIQHLRLHLVNCGIAGIQVSKLDADIPDVTYDLGYAMYKDRLFIRKAGTGRVSLSIDQSNLETFAQQKYGKALKSVKAVLIGDHISVSGEMLILSSRVPFSIEGKVSQRDGRYVEIIEPVVTLSGAHVDATQTQSLLDRINPVMDLKTDLNLEKVIDVHHVYGAGNQLIIEGDIHIPSAPSPQYRALSGAADFDIVSLLP